MSNIELFDEYTARAFAKLYEAFPRRIRLFADELCGHTATDDFGQVLNDAGQPSAHFDVALATIEWLVDTGYIRAGSRTGFGFLDAVLTAQGLLVLKATPDSLNAKEGLGDRIVRLIKSGSIELAKDLAKAAIGLGANMLAPK